MTVSLVSVGGAFDNHVRSASPISTNIFSCRGVPVGYSAPIGQFKAGEIVFGLLTPQGHLYFTGPASRNPDGVAHADPLVAGENSVYIGWEDQFGGGDYDYDDCVIKVDASAVEPNRATFLSRLLYY